jgi:hypothetical protein
MSGDRSDDPPDVRRPNSSDVDAFDLNISTSWSVAARPFEEEQQDPEPDEDGPGECFDLRSVLG